MTAASSLLPAHRDADGNHLPHQVDVLDTTALWLHGLSALAWVGCVGVIVLLALPAARRLLTPAAVRYLEVRLENVIRLSGLFTVLLVLTGIYNLRNNTPYPTPWLSASPSDVLNLPDATLYFLVLTGKLVVYALMLGAAAYLIGRARELSAEPPAEGVEFGSGAGGVLTLSPTTPRLAQSTGTRIAVGVFVGAGLAVLLSLSWLRTLHLVIEGAPTEVNTLSASHDGIPQPLFTKVEVKPDGTDAWLVALTLTDHASQLPPPSVHVTVTGTGPNGVAIGPLDFTETTAGVYQGRVTGPPGNWNLLAVTDAKPGFEVAPTQQSFSVPLAPPAAGTSDKAAKK